MHNPRKEDHSEIAAIAGFQTEMATKRLNLQTAALIEGDFNTLSVNSLVQV